MRYYNVLLEDDNGGVVCYKWCDTLDEITVIMKTWNYSELPSGYRVIIQSFSE